MFDTALQLAGAIRRREISPSEALEESLDAIDRLDPELNAIVWRNDEEARFAAARATDKVMSTEADELPLFHGVPMPVKDLTPVEGWPVTFGSRGAPAGVSLESELIIDRFRDAGFLLTARTNAPEFGPLPVTENLRHGVTRNPWAPELSAGGSSGGAAAAVASGMFTIAHANDGGGSIRIPSSACGLVGLKVSRGRVPTHVRGWEGAAVEGVVTRDVADAAAVLDLTSAPDRGLWYNAPAPERPYRDEVGAKPGRLRIGMLADAPFGLSLDPSCAAAVQQAAALLESLGHVVVPVELDIPEAMVAATFAVANSNLAGFDGIDWSLTEPHIQAGHALAESITSLEYVSAVQSMQRFTRSFVSRWETEFDVLLTSTMTILPPVAGSVLAAAHAAGATPAIEILQLTALTAGFNLTGQPAISVPTHLTSEGVPVGVQLVGAPFDEATLIRLASQLESAVDWTSRRPAV